MPQSQSQISYWRNIHDVLISLLGLMRQTVANPKILTSIKSRAQDFSLTMCWTYLPSWQLWLVDWLKTSSLVQQSMNTGNSLLMTWHLHINLRWVTSLLLNCLWFIQDAACLAFHTSSNSWKLIRNKTQNFSWHPADQLVQGVSLLGIPIDAWQEYKQVVVVAFPFLYLYH